MCLFCNVWVCVFFCNMWVCVFTGFVMCGCVRVYFVMCWCFGNMSTCIYSVFIVLFMYDYSSYAFL
jgi:hypothetical protein